MENVVTLWGENGPKFVQHHAPTYVWVVFVTYIYESRSRTPRCTTAYEHG